MIAQPVYIYKASSPCFTIENTVPFTLVGCSCGWPGNSCKRFAGRTLTDRNSFYKANIVWRQAMPPSDTDRSIK